MYTLHLRARFSLDAPTPVQSDGILYEVLPPASKPGVSASNDAIAPADKRPGGMATYLNGKRASPEEAVAALMGNKTRLDLSRKGNIDPADKRAGRVLVYLLVNPDDHTASLLQGVAPNGFFNPGRDPSKLDVIDHLGVVPDETPLNHKILYVFDPVIGGTTEVTLKDSEFTMQWP